MFAVCGNMVAQVYKDTDQPVEKRVEDLLKRMTLEEKVSQLRHIHGGSILNDDNTLNMDRMGSS